MQAPGKRRFSRLAARLSWPPRWDVGYLAAALLPLVGILLTFHTDGVIRSADSVIHVHNLYAMNLLVRQGNLWPRWVSYYHLGYGYPIFNFYQPLVYHLGAVLGLLGVGAPLAFNLIAAGAWIFGTVGTYALVRAFWPGRAAILAAMLWAYAPSRLFEVWNQGGLPQMAGASLVPWLFLAVALAARHPTRRNLVGIAVLTAALVMTHLPVTTMIMLFVGPAALLMVLWNTRRDRREALRRLLHIGGAFLLAVGLAAIFVLPVAGELPYVQAIEQDPVPELTTNFLQLQDLFLQPRLLDLSDATMRVLPTLGLSWALLALLGLAALLRRRQVAAVILLVLGLGLVVVMTQEASLPIWTSVPFLANARFPWRLFRIGAVLLALAGGAAILLLPRRWQSGGLGIALAAVLLTALPWLYPEKEVIRWDDLSARDEIVYEETDHHWGNTSYNELNPIWGRAIPLDEAPDLDAYATDPFQLVVHVQDVLRQWPDLQVEQVDDSTVRVTVTDSRPVRFRQFYYPGWTATLDGQPAALYPDEEYGLITLDVPTGAHTIHLQYTGTPIQTAGTLISLASLGVAAALFWTGRRAPGTGGLSPSSAPPALVSQSEQDEPLPRRTGLAILGGVIAFALVNALYIGPHTLWFRYRSPPDSPAYMETPVHAFFGDQRQIELLGYTLTGDTITPGGTLDLTLFWRVWGELDRKYWPVVELVDPLSEVYARGRRATSLTSQIRHYYGPEMFLSEDYRLQAPAEAPPYAGRLRITITDGGGEVRLPASNGQDSLLLDPVIHVAGSDPAAARQLAYDFGGVLTLHCASVTAGEAEIAIDLYWHVEAPPGYDYTAFVHGLDADGQMIQQNDGPPLGGHYPTSLWQPGQNLTDHHTLPADPAITAVELGLYRPDTGDRLPITQNGQPVPDGQIVLQVAAHDCLP